MRARAIAGIAILLAVSAATSAQQPAEKRCLQYGPTVVKLAGTIVRKTFPGSPEYEDVRKGDRPEIYWLLKLPAPVCVDEADPAIDTAKQGIREIQLVFLRHEDYKKYRNLVGRRVVATGTLYGEHTVHRRTPVLLTVSSLEKAN